MSRLDKHVGAVQARMALGVWLRGLAWAGIAFAIAVWAAILIDRLVRLELPHQAIWFWCGLGITMTASIVYAIVRRPSRHEAAVAIDDKLALKEKFSTALYVRPSKDPFAMAAVRDAEKTADNVSLNKRFPVKAPKAAGGTAAAIIAVFLTAWLVPPLDLFGVQANRLAKTQTAQEQQRQARDAVHKAIAEIESAPKAVAEKQEIKLALNELKAMRDRPTIDPEHAKATAQKAVEDVEKAMKEKIKQSQEFALTQEEMRAFRNLAPPADQDGPLPDAQRALAQGKFDQAVEDLSKAVDNFDKMNKKDQEKAAQQMKNMANSIKQMANDQAVQEQIKKDLQQAGASQQQAQQMMQMMQAAAAGDKQAAQQLQQAAKQLAQQMNQNGGKSAQQQRQMAQQMQQQMQKMQQRMNAQVSAQQLAQSAMALAQAMQQSAQGGSPGQPKQGGAAQMSNRGNQPGQNGMANAAQQMQQQLQQMQAVANDAQEVAAAQAAAGENGGQNPNGQQQNPGPGNGVGPFGQGANQGFGKAMGGGPGVAGAGNNRPAPEVAPFQVKDETDISQKTEKGKILASTFVKAGSIKGDAKMELHSVLPSVEKQATDEVDEQRIPRQDQDVVRGYFGNLQRDTEK